LATFEQLRKCDEYEMQMINEGIDNMRASRLRLDSQAANSPGASTTRSQGKT
jgi:hypothetical protein